MRIFRGRVGPIDTNCYIVYDVKTRESIMIDPGAISDKVDTAIKDLGRENFSYILLTHGHFDHIGAAEHYRKITGAQIIMNEKEADFTQDGNLNLAYEIPEMMVNPFKPDKLLKDGDTLPIWDTEVKMIETPGHTIGSCCYIIDRSIFTGDTLMSLSIGRTDFPTGDSVAIMESVDKIAHLEGDYKIYPGHGKTTDLKYERENNMYLGKGSYDNIH